jgi:hypothetical protein
MNEPIAPTPGSRRTWTMRLLALSLPLVVLVACELALRLAGLFPDTSRQLTPVGFAAGTNFFPEWEDELEMPRPKGQLRIFTMGGSTTHGFGVEEPFAVLLQKRFDVERSDRAATSAVEVINAGYPSYGSHRVLAIARRASGFSPNWLIVYMGHNEFLEDVFYDPDGLVARMEHTAEFARSLRVVNGMRLLLGEPQMGIRSQLPAQFFKNDNYPLIHSRAEVILRLKLLREHIREIIAAANRVGAGVVIIPAVPNLLVPPGDSVHGPGVDGSSGRWLELEGLAAGQFEARDWDGLSNSCDELLRMDDGYAISHYWSGMSLLGRGRIDEGRTALVEANRRDQRGIRSNADVIETMVEATREEGAILLTVDPLFDREFEAEFKRRMAGRDQSLFIDHCHPSQRGHAMIANAVFELLQERQPGGSGRE